MVRKKFYSPNDRDGNMTKILNALFILLIIALLLSLDSCCSYKQKTKETVDTTIVDIRNDSIVFETNPVSIFDSTKPNIITKPFIFKIDTVFKTISKTRTKNDTLKLFYRFPENLLNFSYLPEQDTTKQINKSETVTKIEELTFWDYIPTALLFLIIGFVIGKLR